MLNKLIQLREEREDGFTLIELLVVVLIIGILAAIAIPVFLNQQKSANDGGVESDLKNAATLAETWKVDNPNVALNPATTFKGFKQTSGVTLALVKSSNTADGSYKLCAYHSNGNTSAASPWVYDSNGGGFSKTPGSQKCEAANITALTF